MINCFQFCYNFAFKFNLRCYNKPLSSTIAVELEFADGSFKTMTSDDRTVFTLISGGDLGRAVQVDPKLTPC